MLRRVVFEQTAAGREHFDIIYSGMLLAVADASSKAVDKLEGRMESRIIRKLQAISQIKLDEKTGQPVTFATGEEVRELTAGTDHTLDFEQQEITLMTERIERVRWFATKRMRAFDTIDYLDAAEKVEPSESKLRAVEK